MNNTSANKPPLTDRHREVWNAIRNVLSSHRQGPSIQPVPRTAKLPLSFMQQRLWFLNQLEPDNPAYNLPVIYHLTGQLEVVALEKSICEIVRRHEILRTTFPSIDGQPFQLISPELELKLPLIDLQEYPKTEWDAEIQRRSFEEIEPRFDLTHGPLWRLKLLRLTKRQHVLLVIIHHLIFDGRSIEIFLRELAIFYKYFLTGEFTSLPDLPIQYADFAVWQRQWLQADILASQLAYWKQKLGNTLPKLELPTDRQRPAAQTHHGEIQSFSLSSKLFKTLKEISRQEGVTTFMTMLAAFETLLYRYTGQEDLVVGSLITNRNRAEVENLIGFFVNTSVLRTNLSGNPSFRELLGRIRHTAIGAYVHQDLPFEKLVEELRPERDLSHTPLFQVMCNYMRAPTLPADIPNLTLRSINLDSKTAKFDLTLDLEEVSEGLRGGWEYNTDLFDAATITRMIGHFHTILEAVVADPDQRINRLPVMSEPERYQVLITWNNTKKDYPSDASIVKLFEAQAERTPDATAFLYQDRKLTYRELNRRANQVAHYLKKLGVKSDVVVGLCLERSLDMVVGFWGILKAGGVYLPLDPSYPQERLLLMFEHANAQVLLTKKGITEALPEGEARRVYLDSDIEISARQLQVNPADWVSPENLAYIIYTSGSTGQPKGVAVPHKQIINRLTWMWEAYPFAAGDVGCQKTSLNFVDSIWELLGSLLCGVPTVIIPDYILKDPNKFIRALTRSSVTRLWVVPSLLRMMLDAVPNLQLQLPKLKFWVTSGEPISIELVQRFYKCLPQSVLYNLYGTSEVWDVTWHETNPRDMESPRVPIGRPIANMQTYILDENRQPVPVGVPGELYVGGLGLARGYINDPELTTSVFIPNLFSNQPGERLYRTKDLVRYLPDGNIEYLGRSDAQIKIRGYRLEPAEVEAALALHSAVHASTVATWEDTPGEKRLVAYIVLKQNQLATTSDLRNFLQRKLPEYMIPSDFVLLDALPLTPSGKVDRCALPRPKQRRPELEKAYLAPRDTSERQLTSIWEKVLGIKPIGVHDNFFELGGHSMLAVYLITQIEKILGRSIPLTFLFQSPTVAQLAAVLFRPGRKTAGSTLIALNKTGPKPPLFCIPAVASTAIGFVPLAKYLGPDQPVYAFQPLGMELDGTQNPHDCIEEMALHYNEEMLTIQPHNPHFLAGMCFGGFVALEMARQLQAQGRDVALLALFDTPLPEERPTSTSRYLTRKLVQRYRIYFHDHKRFELQLCALPQLIKNQFERLKSLHNHSFSNQRVRRLQRIENAHMKAMRNYHPRTYSGRTVCFFCNEFVKDNMGERWSELIEGGVEIHHIPCQYQTMLNEPHVHLLAEKLKACLDLLQLETS